MKISVYIVNTLVVLQLLSIQSFVVAGDGITKAKIASIYGRLRYDSVFFGVNPGSKVELALANTNKMLHNGVLCQPDDDVMGIVGAPAIDWSLS